jgi:hypothetical protein
VPATFYIASLPFQDAPQIGGYRLSSAGQRQLQSVTGERWLLTPDRRIGAGERR